MFLTVPSVPPSHAIVLAWTNSCAHQGVESYRVRVEARVTTGLPQLTVVGLPDAAVREGRERVRSAIRATVADFPTGRGLVNLSPASRRKAGATFDLAVAVALLTAAELCPQSAVADTAFLGELGLDGCLVPVAGCLPAALCAARSGLKRLIVPRGNADEAAIADIVEIYPAGSLQETVGLIRSGFATEPHRVDLSAIVGAARVANEEEDLADIRGQYLAKRALEIAAVGRHHLLICGPPGCGKTMLARRLPSLLPPMSMDEAVETTAIHSIAGLGRPAARFSLRPFRSPHHSISGAGLIGGGAVPSPGEISLAHNGVLFLDELPEFAPHILNQLREPLEEGSLTISRAGGNLTFPSRFLLIAAMNPCPCGFYASGVRECSCSPGSIVRYRSRVSGPLLDRIDLHINLLPVDFSEFRTTRSGESSELVRERVDRALNYRATRNESDLSMNAEASRLLARAFPRMALTMRALKRIVAVARSIADLATRDQIEPPHLAEALQYRSALCPSDPQPETKGGLHWP